MPVVRPEEINGDIAQMVCRDFGARKLRLPFGLTAEISEARDQEMHGGLVFNCYSVVREWMAHKPTCFVRSAWFLDPAEVAASKSLTDALSMICSAREEAIGLLEYWARLVAREGMN